MKGAVANVEAPIAKALIGREIDSTHDLDDLLLKLDGTEQKSRLGANALLSVSLAFTRACAIERGVPLYRHFAELGGSHELVFLPRPTINLFSGGLHAGGQVAIQDVLVVPASARTIDEALEMTARVFQSAARLTAERFGARALVADEGGLAPAFESSEEMLVLAVESVERAGLAPGEDVALAVDVAASHFYRDGSYHLDGETLDAAKMVARLDAWVDRYGLVSVEDGLFEDAWDEWALLCRRIGSRTLVLGDDFLVTNPARIDRAILAGSANALLLKVNQIGTLSEAAEAYRKARTAGWRVTVSARSGETEDDWLADLAVGWQGDQIKIGSITRSERLAKYNRLLWIERETKLPMVGWPNR